MQKKKILILTMGMGKVSYKDLDAETMVRLQDNKTLFGVYNDTEYVINGKQIHAIHVAEPLIREENPDTVFLIGTVRSAWTSVYSTFAAGIKRDGSHMRELISIEKGYGKDTGEQELQEIQDRIQQYFDEAELFRDIDGCCVKTVKVIVTKYGLNDEELQYNYRKLSEIEKEMEDAETEYEVSFDITNSFRSLPIYNLAIINYLRVLSTTNIRISHVYYGNVEVRKENNDVAPVVDLGDLVEVMDLTTAVGEFKNTGSVRSLLSYIPEDDEELTEVMEKFEWSMQTNDLNMMQYTTEALRECLRSRNVTPRYADLYKMLLRVLEENYPSEQEFSDLNDIDNKPWALGNVQRKIGVTFLKQERYGMAVVAGTEALVSFLIPYYLRMNELAVNIDNCKEWKYRSSISVNKLGGFPAKKEEHSTLFAHLRASYFRMREIRNMVAHIGEMEVQKEKGNDEENRVPELKRAIKDYYNDLNSFGEMFSEQFQVIDQILRKIYIRVSNKDKLIVSSSQGKKKKKGIESITGKYILGSSPLFNEKTLRRLDKRESWDIRVLKIKKEGILGKLKDGREIQIPLHYVTEDRTIHVNDQIQIKFLGKATSSGKTGIPVETINRMKRAHEK